MEHQMDYFEVAISRRLHRKPMPPLLPISPPPPQTITHYTFRRHLLHFTIHKWRPLLLLPLPLDNNVPHNWKAISTQHRRFIIHHTGEFLLSKLIIDLVADLSLSLGWMMKILHNDIMLNHMARERD
jgi:hypothetical protein